MRVFLTIILVTFSCLDSLCQFQVDAQLRNRFEVRDGYQKLAEAGSAPAIQISQRTRISFIYVTEKIKIKIAPQDVRLWGGDAVVNSTGVPSNTNIGLFEGFAEIRTGEFGWLSVGRQQLVYDSRRLLGDRQWNQNGMSYDALVMKLKLSDWNLHLGGTWNTLTDARSGNLYPSSRVKTIGYVWANRAFSEFFSTSFLHISSGVTETDTTGNLNFRQTTGVYYTYRRENLNMWGNVFYQYGKNRSGKDVRAVLADFDLSYKNGRITPGFGLGYLSGNSTTGAGQTTDRLFDVLAGNRHSFFGIMDYFRSFPSDTRQGGLADYYFYIDYKISTSVSIRNTGHYFRLAQTNSGTPLNKNLGYENDLVLKYKMSDWGAFESGYSFFLPTTTLKTVQGVPNEKFSQFLYVQLTLTPILFRQ